MSQLVTPGVRPVLTPPEHHMNKLGRCPQGDAKNQISKLYTFQRKRILKMEFFVPMFQLVTPGLGPILTLGASYEQTWKRSTRRCYIPNIKALALTVWDKKIFKKFLLHLYVKSENQQQMTNFLSRAIILSILVEGHYMMLHAKYESSSPNGLGQDNS